MFLWVQVKNLKKRIEQLRNGIFEYEAPKMLVSEEKIEAVIQKGAVFRGSFTIESENQKRMKGFLYSSSPRMAYEPSDFHGISERVVYELDASGMEEGDVLDGRFTICSELGEYQVPYHIEIARNLVKTSTEVIGSLADFEKLAKEDFQKAHAIFTSGEFRKMLTRQAPQWMTLYEGLTGKTSDDSDMEEFLVGIGAKKKISIALERKKAFFEGLNQTQKENVRITKDNWGFQRMEISTDAEFLQTERTVVTSDEFIGSSCYLNYLIYPEKLHAGKNYGRIFIKTPFQTLAFEITVKKTEKKGTSHHRSVQKQKIKSLIERYLDFRLDRISREEWSEESLASLEEYRNAGGTEPMAELYQAHILFLSDREEEACLVLTEFEREREMMKRPEIQGYYLYLTTFYHKDQMYLDYVQARIGELAVQKQENWKLQWYLFHLPEKRNVRLAEKLEIIRRQFRYGCRSRLMYLEAYQIIRKCPLLLKKFGEFELCLMRFVCREGLLDDELILQTGDLAARHKEYSPMLYDILKQCYARKPSGSLAGDICSLLIKGNKEGEEYFSWYEKAVKADIRLTGLYEHYVNSMRTDTEEPLPQMIKMYFAYNNTLSYRRKALVYASVIRNRENDPRTFKNYRPVIEKFMEGQLAAGHINRELALIYRTFLHAAYMDRRMAERLAGVIFSSEIRCASPDARYAVVIHRQLEEEQRVALWEKRAVAQLYTDDYQIFFEDEKGNRLVSIPCEAERLLEDMQLLEICRNMAGECPEMTLYTCGKAEKEKALSEENVKDFCRLLEIKKVRESYKAQIRQRLLDFYYENPNSPSLFEFLHAIHAEEFIRTDKRKLLSLMTMEGMCQEAFAIVETYGPEGVDTGVLVRMCSRNILVREHEADDMLLAVCWYCFEKEKYDETVLAYLVKHYDGPVENMKRLWRAGRQFELDTYELEEKILLVLVFMRHGAENTEEIFDSYRRNMGKKPLLEAYVTDRSYDYFVKEASVQEPVFAYIEDAYGKGKEMQEMCLLALLRWYSGQPRLTEARQEAVQQLLEEFHGRGMQFAFYKAFGQSLLRPFQMVDKSYVEYRANPEASVTLTWQIEKMDGKRTKEISEKMKNVCEGIFVREFTLFYGETLHYSIQEECGGVMREMKEKTLPWDERNSTGGDTCYDLINRLAKALADQDEKAAEDVMELYLEQECLAKNIFPGNE